MNITRETPRNDLPEMLRVEEAAAWLDISKGCVYSMAQSGELRSVKFGRLLRIPRDTLFQYIDGTLSFKGHRRAS